MGNSTDRVKVRSIDDFEKFKPTKFDCNMKYDIFVFVNVIFVKYNYDVSYNFNNIRISLLMSYDNNLIKYHTLTLLVMSNNTIF